MVASAIPPKSISKGKCTVGSNILPSPYFFYKREGVLTCHHPNKRENLPNSVIMYSVPAYCHLFKFYVKPCLAFKEY